MAEINESVVSCQITLGSETFGGMQDIHMLNVQEEEVEEEDDEELEDELLDCLMCRNETLVDFLRKHIKFHHMIQVHLIVTLISHEPTRIETSFFLLFFGGEGGTLINMNLPQEDSIVEKLFSMHFPSEAASMETQTQVPWHCSCFLDLLFVR